MLRDLLIRFARMSCVSTAASVCLVTGAGVYYLLVAPPRQLLFTRRPTHKSWLPSADAAADRRGGAAGGRGGGGYQCRCCSSGGSCTHGDGMHRARTASVCTTPHATAALPSWPGATHVVMMQGAEVYVGKPQVPQKCCWQLLCCKITGTAIGMLLCTSIVLVCMSCCITTIPTICLDTICLGGQVICFWCLLCLLLCALFQVCLSNELLLPQRHGALTGCWSTFHAVHKEPQKEPVRSYKLTGSLPVAGSLSKAV